METETSEIKDAADRVYALWEEAISERKAERPSDAAGCSPSSKTPKTDAVVASIIPPYLRSCHTTRKIAVHAEEMEEKLNHALSALKMLYDAADVYAADQSQAKDERIGLVQPITAEDGRALNEALVVAAKIVENSKLSQPKSVDNT